VQALRLVNELLRQPRLSRAPFTDLKAFFDGALHSIKRRSLVFIVSDFISAPGWERPLSLLSQRHETLAIRLTDPRETELPDVGMVTLEDAETGEQMFVDTHDPAFRRNFQAAAQRRETMLNEAFKHAGVDTMSLSTEDDLARAIVRFARQRQRRRK
jgi:uncharacterized protein (DUF58 family)